MTLTEFLHYDDNIIEYFTTLIETLRRQDITFIALHRCIIFHSTLTSFEHTLTYNDLANRYTEYCDPYSIIWILKKEV